MLVNKLNVIFVFLALATSGAAAPIDVGSRRELFLDRCLIETLTNTTLKLHEPEYAGVVLRRELPWEGLHTFGYMTVLKDGGRYRMYYRAHPGGDYADGDLQEATCYAESTDGIHWVKPKLNIYEIQGTKKNNVVLAGMPPYSHNFAPFLDARPGVPAAERYKALAGLSHGSGGIGLVAFVSPDGIHWKKLREEPVLGWKKLRKELVLGAGTWAFDSQNVAFWSESEKCYVCYFRVFTPKTRRTIARSTSKDFVHWSAPVLMKYGDKGTTPPEQFYTNQTQPYFRASHIYIATPARFMEGRRSLGDAQVKELGIDKDVKWLKNDCSDTVLLSTRGGDRYEWTFREAFVRPGLGPRNWVSRSNYAACGIVPTGPTEMSLYVCRHNAQESVHVARYTLRTDGFASVSASADGGEMLTKPLLFAGDQLEINYSTSAAGSIRVEIQDAEGQPIPGFALEDCPEIIGDQIERTVSWKQGPDLSALAGKPVRLRFVLQDADLYAFQFVAK